MKLLTSVPQDSKYDVFIVGCGLSGAVVAEQLAKKGYKILIIDKRDHIGGNCYDYKNDYGILMNKYGAHLFHTNIERVWEYVNRFSEWVRWEHKVLGCIDDKFVPIPVNITTVNEVLNQAIQTENQMGEWLEENQIKYPEGPKNSEEMAKSRVGEILYEKVFKHYTKKQWNKYPNELVPSVLARIPVRPNFDPRYFADKYQALPRLGYTHFFEKLLDHPNIDVVLNADFFEVSKHVIADVTVYTGPIDHYYSSLGLPALEYRSLRFDIIDKPNMNYYQPNSVVNYLQPNVPFTRIIEYKHFLNQKSEHTTIVMEFSSAEGEPYYPVLNETNMQLYEKYKKMAEEDEKRGVIFVGRLANYKYFNMDQAIDNALDVVDRICQGPFISKK